MSWSAYFVGSPDKIIEALKKQSEQLTGQSKEEFDAVLPHISGLLELNKNVKATPALRLSASGHGYNGEYNHVQVNIENVGAVV